MVSLVYIMRGSRKLLKEAAALLALPALHALVAGPVII
jgi:hypothetical protein